MKKRILSMILAVVMIAGVFPTFIVPASALPVTQEEATELYIQMLLLGIVDQNGALIENTVFLEADSGSLLAANLTELRAVFASPDLDLSKTVQVWGNGGTATLEQLFVALSIEEQMAELAYGMNALAGGTRLMNTLGGTAAANTDLNDYIDAEVAKYGSQTELSYSVTANADGTISLVFSIGEGHSGVGIDVGLFADFLDGNALSSLQAGNRTFGVNAYVTQEIAAGETSMEIRFSGTALSNLLASGNQRHFDGNAYATFQFRILYGAAYKPGNTRLSGGTTVFSVAPSESSTAPKVEWEISEHYAQTNGEMVELYSAYAPVTSITQKKDEQQYVITGNGGEDYIEFGEIGTFYISDGADDGNVGNTYTLTSSIMKNELQAIIDLGMGDRNDPQLTLDTVIVGKHLTDALDYTATLQYYDQASPSSDKWENMPGGSGFEDISYSWPQASYDSDGNTTGADVIAQRFIDIAESQELDRIPTLTHDYGADIGDRMGEVISFKANLPLDLSGATVGYPTRFRLITPRTLNPEDGIYYTPNGNTRDAYDWKGNEWMADYDGVLLVDKAYLADTTAPTIQSITVPDITFVSGQKIPITVTFSEPVYGNYRLYYNKATTGSATGLAYLEQADRGDYTAGIQNSNAILSNTRTFFYEVQGVDSTLIAVLGVGKAGNTCTDYIGGNELAHSLGFEYAEYEASLANISSEEVLNSFREIGAGISDENKLTGYIYIGKEYYTLWMDWYSCYLSQQDEDPSNDRPLPFVFFAALDGDTSKQLKITGTNIPVWDSTSGLPAHDWDLNLAFDELEPVYEDTRHIVQLYYSADPDIEPQIIYQADLYYTPTQWAITKVPEGKYAISLPRMVGFEEMWSPHFMLAASVWPSAEKYVVYQLDSTATRIARSEKPYTEYSTGTMGQAWATGDFEELTHFLFTSSDETVLTVDANGYIVPHKPGNATITLWATNGSDDPTNYSFQENIEITVKDGGAPGIVIPTNANTFYTTEREDVTVSFLSNLASADPDGNPITVKLYRGQDAVSEENLVFETSAARLATTVTIPGQYLTDISVGDTPSYTLTLSTEVTTDATVTRTATGYVVVRAQPAVVKLTGLDNTSLPADGSVTFGWTVEHLDPINSNNAFELLITREGETIHQQTDANAAASGFYTLNLEHTGADLRTVYVITVKAKNHSDPTWSTDSRVVNVYPDGALKILVGGVDAGDNVTLENEVAESTTTSNPTITNLSGEQFASLDNALSIAQLRGALGLVESLTIDTSSYDWNNLTDMVEWASDNPDAVTVNYLRGSLYEPIEKLRYTAYMPKAILMLCGEGDGSGIITASHSMLTGMTDSVTVHVDRLVNQLYLFQFSPAVTTTVSYYDGNGVEKTVTSNTDGSLALYEPYGIGTDQQPYLWATAQTIEAGQNVTYMGGWNVQELRSGEGIGTLGHLYPLNSLEMRRAAYAAITLLKPDGTPYANEIVTLRGGVYRNGEYCEDAAFSNAATNTPGDDGETDLLYRTDKNGVLHVYSALNQFTTASERDAVSRGDMLQFIFEIRFGTKANGYTDYFPILHTVDASLNSTDTTRIGEHIVMLKDVPTDKQQIFVAAQKLDYNIGRMINCLDHTGVIGPSANYPEVTLVSEIMLWGQKTPENEGYTAVLTDKYLVEAPSQSYRSVADSTYPFSSIALIRHTATFNDDNLWFDGSKENRDLSFYIKRNSSMATVLVLPFRLVNMFDIERIEESSELLSLMTSIELSGAVTGQNTADRLINGTSDYFLEPVIKILSTMGTYTGTMKAILSPTEDPTRYTGYFWMGLDTMGLDDVPYNADGVFVEGNFGEFMISDALGYDDFQAMADGSFFKDATATTTAISTAMGIPVVAQMEGWLSTEIRYNFDDMKWDVITTGGGFTAGAGIRYGLTFNVKPAGIPLTATFELEADMAVTFETAVRYAEQLGLEWNDDTAKAVNDYLTALRIRAYFEAFGGLGHDKGFTAKVGAFGSIEIDNENRFLTREYLQNPAKRNLEGQYLKLEGESGLRVEFGAGPMIISITLASVGFGADWDMNDWDEISHYWAHAVSDPGGTGEIMPALMNMRLMRGNGLQVVDQSIRVESRDYLDAPRSWNGGVPRQILLRSGGTNGLDSLQTNAYPNSYPHLSDDGALLVYLSDRNSTNVADVRASASLSVGGAFPEGYAIDDNGYGDSALTLDGTSSFAGAVWLRQMNDAGIEAGDAVDVDKMNGVLNGMDVMAAIWNGSRWSTTRITDNSTQEFSPVIAVSGNRAIAVWRAVDTVTSEEQGKILEVQRERLLYKLYDGSNWSSETYTLFNGSSGKIKGIDVEMLSGGTAAVAYSLDTGSEGKIEEYEMCYALVDTADSDHENTARTIRITTDEYLDEMPQLTTVRIGNEEHFVLGWHSYQKASGVETHDLRLAAFAADGAPRTDIPGSLNEMVGVTSFNGQFAFAEGAGTIDQLSIVYTDAGTGTDGGDVLRSIKLIDYGSSYISSAPAMVAQIPFGGALEHYDAYVSGYDGMEIKAVLQADVPTGEVETVNVITMDTYGIETPKALQVMKNNTQLYTANASYTNSFSVDEVVVDYVSLAANSYVPISFTITNQGIEPMDSVNIIVGMQSAQTVSLNGLLPGKSKIVSAVYQTGNSVENVDYAVTNGTVTQTGTIHLDYPDLDILNVITIDEVDGKRSFVVNLTDKAAAELYQADRRVVFGVFADSTFTAAMDGKYFEGGTAGQEYTITLHTEDALDTVDQSSYPVKIVFDAAGFAAAQGLSEIPSGGIPLYLQVRAEERLPDGTWLALPEATLADNQELYMAESLLSRNGGETIRIQTSVDNSSGNTVAEVTVQNNSLAAQNAGIVTAVLLGASGSTLETQKVGNITLGTEGRESLTFAFTQAGAQVLVSFVTADSTANNAELASITVGDSIFAVTGDSMELPIGSGTHSLILSPKNPKASVTVNGEKIVDGVLTVYLTNSKKIIPVVVTSEDGTAQKYYEIVLGRGTNTEPVPPSVPDIPVIPFIPVVDTYPPIIKDSVGGRVTVLPQYPKAGDTVTVTTIPDAGYTADEIIVTDKNGNSVGVVDNGDGTYGFKQPTGIVTISAAFRKINTTCPGDSTCPMYGYTDLDIAEWYHDGVHFCLESGLMNGMGDNQFNPSGTTTRAMLVTLLWRLEGSPVVNYLMDFEDVPQNQWYTEAVRWAASEKIVEGYGDGQFGTNDPTTREQLATILYRYEQYKGGGFVGVWMSRMDYADLEEVSEWAYEAMCWCSMNGIVNGRPGKILDPKGTATRAEAATMLYRYCEKSANE